MHKPTIAFLSTYPPRECGIATFTQDLLKSSQKFLGSTFDCKVAALNLSPLETYKYPSEVMWELDQNNESDFAKIGQLFTKKLNISGVIIQHEYGIFGGVDGEFLLTFMEECKKPMLVTLHTALPDPNPHMKLVTSRIIELASTIVVLTRSSKEIIEKLYPHAIGKTFVVPHGIHHTPFSHPKKFKIKLELENHIILSTFGLLSRGKGIEYAIRALPDVIKKYPSTLYLILGQTHPVILRSEGEKYRLELASIIKELHLEKHVKFYDQYFTLADLIEFLKATDIYIATSTNPNQAVSGTLSYALGTGLAVISTEFAQAKEIITSDTGRLVPIKDSPALSHAIFDLLSDPDRLERMHENAYKITRPMLWNTVAEKYSKLLTRLTIPPLNLTHLENMTDTFGLFQFAIRSTPNKDSGYTLDDNARALIVTNWLLQRKSSSAIEKLFHTYFTFLKKCQLPDGSFVNYIDTKKKAPTQQNLEEDLEESQTRALWALSEIIANEKLKTSVRTKAKKMLLLYLQQNRKLIHLRSKAYAIKAYAQILQFIPENKTQLLKSVREHANSLTTSLNKNSIKSWRWFENELNYNNALLSESLLIAGRLMQNDEYTENGLSSLQFLISKTFSSKFYIPIGHFKWYKNKGKRSEFDQQPEDPTSMIIALTRAYKYTHEVQFKNLAQICFSWFLGNNSLNQSLYNPKNGGCYDGLHPDRVNLNQGAESLISYIMAHIHIRQLD